MKKLKSQSGRSMVEMLGVLAIIGVLSVGGIAGYSLGMRKHRANGIVDVASKYAVVAYNQCQQKLLNGEITGETVETDARIKGCDGDNSSISFEDAEVGNKPAGVKKFENAIVEHEQNSDIDTVVVSISFDDDKLCQAVGSISGIPCEGWGDGLSHTAVKIRQN